MLNNIYLVAYLFERAFLLDSVNSFKYLAKYPLKILFPNLI
jgi:hypothetical protein